MINGSPVCKTQIEYLPNSLLKGHKVWGSEVDCKTK